MGKESDEKSVIKKKIIKIMWLFVGIFLSTLVAEARYVYYQVSI